MPPRKLPSVKRARPMINIRRRPRMSPDRPPSSSRPPKVSVYALSAHVMDVWFLSKYSPMVGRAMFTMVASSMTINWAPAMSSSTKVGWAARRAPFVVVVREAVT
jgi:hypothetical protein